MVETLSDVAELETPAASAEPSLAHRPHTGSFHVMTFHGDDGTHASDRFSFFSQMFSVTPWISRSIPSGGSHGGVPVTVTRSPMSRPSRAEKIDATPLSVDARSTHSAG